MSRSYASPGQLQRLRSELTVLFNGYDTEGSWRRTGLSRRCGSTWPAPAKQLHADHRDDGRGRRLRPLRPSEYSAPPGAPRVLMAALAATLVNDLYSMVQGAGRRRLGLQSPARSPSRTVLAPGGRRQDACRAPRRTGPCLRARSRALTATGPRRWEVSGRCLRPGSAATANGTAGPRATTRHVKGNPDDRHRIRRRERPAHRLPEVRRLLLEHQPERPGQPGARPGRRPVSPPLRHRRLRPGGAEGPQDSREDRIIKELHRLETAQADHLLQYLGPIETTDWLLDAGSGRGGTSFMANQRFGCQVDGVSISEYQVDSPTTRPAARRGQPGALPLPQLLDTGFETGSMRGIWTNETTMYVNLHQRSRSSRGCCGPAAATSASRAATTTSPGCGPRRSARSTSTTSATSTRAASTSRRWRRTAWCRSRSSTSRP